MSVEHLGVQRFGLFATSPACRIDDPPETNPAWCVPSIVAALTVDDCWWDGALTGHASMHRTPKTATRLDALARAGADGRASPSAYAGLNAAMERYADGDDAAFAALYEGLAPRLASFLLRMTGNVQLASDLSQEAFLRVHRSRGHFERGSAVVPWALAIARNGYRDHLRRTAVSFPADLAESADPGADPVERAASDTGHAEDHLSARETARIIRDAMSALPASQREAFVLLRFEGLTLAEAAEVLGTTETAVKLRKFRAYEAIRRALASASADTKEPQ